MEKLSLRILHVRGSFVMFGLFLCLATAVLAQSLPPWAQGPPLWAGGPPSWVGSATVPTAGVGQMRTFSWIRQDAGKAKNAALPAGFSPSNMQAAYNIPLNGAASTTTIAIVDAYDSPNVASDLAYFSSTFSTQLGSCATPKFTKVNQTGGTSYPRRDSGWEVEINLDTQWAHAMAPCASILLVEANSSSNGDLQTAVSYAMKHASIVSMSWGSNESSRYAQSQLAFEQVFATNPNNVTFVASSGDTGGVVISPSSSPNVIAVGGTQLVLSNGAYAETAWNGSGGGCSIVEKAGSFTAQTSFLPTTPPACTTRGTPDVSMSGGGASAVAVYISKQGGWFQVYGTSLSSPMFAGVVAIGKSKTPLVTVAPSTLYSIATSPGSTYYSSNYRDITAYYNNQAGTDPFKVLSWWDFVTGLGSPKATALTGSL